MADELVEYSPWDNRPRDSMSREEMMEVMDRATTCVFIRLRGDGHPVGAAVGGGVLDGEIYTLTNVFRAAYGNILRDPRCSVVFDAGWASVTIIGRAEIIDDPALLERFVRRPRPEMYAPAQHPENEEDRIAWTATPNRRLVHIIPEKFFSSDLRWLSDPEKIELWKRNKKWPVMTAPGGEAVWWPRRQRAESGSDS